MMDVVMSPKPNNIDADADLVSLASAFAAAAAGGLLATSLASSLRRRRLCSGQLALGLLAGCAAAAVWTQRDREAEAARQLLDRFQDARDSRWLRKNPINYA